MKKTLNADNRKTLVNKLNNLYDEVSRINGAISIEISTINKIENKKDLSDEQRKKLLSDCNNYLFNMTINLNMTENNIKYINQIITENEY